MDRRGSTEFGLDIDGNVKLNERRRQIQEFIEVNSPYMILLLSTRDGEWGIYLNSHKSEKYLEDGEIALGSCEAVVESIFYPKILDGVQKFVFEKRISYVRIDGQSSIQSFHNSKEVKIANIGILAEAYETSLDISSAAEMFVISKDLVLKFLVQQSIKYWEGRGARMKWKWKIIVVSYHPP
ncbi:unnamed protein product [Cuscuta europaea]|uniref:Uncharacterized protein n=1 Tax=Cuscuta europaea TaxID=41803 RepID=A0A9P0YMF5_CUSEU|nr:unnamed protein product [Cuscuta europaea]